MKTWCFKMVVKGVILAVVATAVLGFIVTLLWNALIPALFNGPSISFWQAVGLLLLSHILLRGWSPWRHGNGWRRDRWRRRFEEKLAAMTPEERERIKEGWKHRCGPSPEWPEESKAGA
jgi:hypothetical protein